MRPLNGSFLCRGVEPYGAPYFRTDAPLLFPHRFMSWRPYRVSCSPAAYGGVGGFFPEGIVRRRDRQLSSVEGVLVEVVMRVFLCGGWYTVWGVLPQFVHPHYCRLAVVIGSTI